jgi:uncharacterized protein YndB with AHSA1/START domain
MAAKNKPNEIYLTRIYDAPLKMVWEAWTDPKQVGKWWGPRGYTLTTSSMDVKTGGTWSYVMHGPDGTDYVNKTKYLEVEKYTRMVYDHGGNDDRPALFRVTVDFTETKGKTKIEMVMALATAEAAQEAKKFIKHAGGNSTWDRLAEYLGADKKFVINRSFDAPIDAMFEMWTNPEHISRWIPPTGFTMKFIKADILVGAECLYSMSGSGITMYGKMTYKEISEPSRLVYTQIFSDENGNLARHPMSPTWPETMLTTVTLAEEGEAATRVTVEWEVYGDATGEERATFQKEKAGMTQGWTGSFDKLDEYVTTSRV